MVFAGDAPHERDGDARGFERGVVDARLVVADALLDALADGGEERADVLADGVAGLSGDGLRGARRGARGVARGALRAPAAADAEGEKKDGQDGFHGMEFPVWRDQSVNQKT